MPRTLRMPSLSFIVARSHPGQVIGVDNLLPWKLSSDLKRFRQITTGHAIVMGRKTFESIGRPLPGRTNIVLTRKPTLPNQGGSVDEETGLYWASSKDDALFAADLFSVIRGRDEFFVIGGAHSFETFTPLANRVYLTEVHADLRGDAYFTTTFPKERWTLAKQIELPAGDKDQYGSTFKIYERREQIHRDRQPSAFADLTGNTWLCEQSRRNLPAIARYAQHSETGS